MGGSGGAAVEHRNDRCSFEQVLSDAPEIASARALSAVSRTEINPSGLSSRSISPVSVIQEMVWRPENSISTRKAGIGIPPARTISRSPTFTVTGAFRNVAGSKTFHS